MSALNGGVGSLSYQSLATAALARDAEKNREETLERSCHVVIIRVVIYSKRAAHQRFAQCAKKGRYASVQKMSIYTCFDGSFDISEIR